MMAQKAVPARKDIAWLASTKKGLLALPDQVIDTFGYALHLAQTGHKHEQAKPLQGFGSAGVLEIVEDWRGNTYRGLHRPVGARRLRAPRVSEEIEARHCNAEAGPRFDS